MTNKIIMVNTSMLEHHPDNPRKNIGDVTELADSIRAKGILQNLTVVPSGKADGKYYVVIGNRRLEASLAAGLEELPCVISDMDYKTQIETMMVENIQREDLTVVEQAEGMQLMLDLGSSVEEISEKTGFSSSTVRRRLKLNDYDKKNLVAAQDRGATLADFIKLEQIKTKPERNKLLKLMGTADFNLEFKRTLEEQENKELEKLALKELKTFAEPFPENENTWSSKWQRQNNLSYDLKNFKAGKRVPKTKNKKYYYKINHWSNRWCVDIYIKNENYIESSSSKPKKTEKQKEVDRAVRQLNKIAREHYELRKEFIKSLAQKKNIKDYESICLDVIMSNMFKYGYFSQSNNYNKIIAEFLNIDYLYGNYEKLKSAYYSNPDGMSVLLTYRILEDSENLNCYEKSYDGSKVTFRESKKLKLIYRFLTALGYEMSTEENQVTTGTFELYD